LGQIHELLAPAVFIDEAAGALTKAERQKDIAVGQAAPLYAKVMNSSPILIPHAALIVRAIDISSRTRSGYYDCLYVALAEREGCELVTADLKSFNNLSPHFPFIVPLVSLP
jgi:predicted nucleic acid-binding protein